MNSTLVEFVELQARGIADVQQQIDALSKSTDEAANNWIVLAKAANDPRFQSANTRMERAKQAQAEINRLTRENLRAEEQRARLVSRYGAPLGGALNAGQRFAASRLGGMAGRGAMALGAGIMAGAAAGFSGTVEGNKFANELKLINRELASAFLPAMKAVTSVLRGLRMGLQSLGGNGQNAVMAGGLALGGAGALRLASNVAGGALGTAIGGAGGRLAGGAVAGAGATAGGSALGGGGAIASTIGTGPAALATIFDGIRKAALMKGVQGVQERSPSKLAGAYLNYMSPGTLVTEAVTGQFMSKKKRDQVTIADAGLDAVGTGYERVGQGLSVQMGQDSTQANTTATQQNTSTLHSLAEMLGRWLSLN